MIDKLQKVEDRFLIVEGLISAPEVISDRARYSKLTKEHSDLFDVVEKFRSLKIASAKKEQSQKEILTETDKEMKELLEEEIDALSGEIEQIHEDLKVLLLPKDPNDDKNVIVEIRAGAGGDEAALFGANLVRMYKMFADKKRWSTETLENNITELGGVKEVSFLLKGTGAYSKLKYESGVHRVQRVPETESMGRVHTSTVTVAVLPEAEDLDVQIDEKDLKIDTYRSGGAGGQHVNKTESAIRITHLPTGIVVTCEDERSQVKNRDKAMKVLKSRVYDHFEQIANKEMRDQRKSQVGTGDRSERIRTYNYPQGRVTDHRIGFTLYSLENFLSGDIDEMLDALRVADQNAKLAGTND